MKPIIAVVLAIVFQTSIADTVKDESLQFSVDVPAGAKIDRVENSKGRSVNIIFHDARRNEMVSLSAVRANNGGCGDQPQIIASKMLAGASSSLERQPDEPLRVFPYGARNFYITSHSGIGKGNAQTLTTVYFPEDKVAWCKVITLQFLNNELRGLSNRELNERLVEIRFESSI